MFGDDDIECDDDDYLLTSSSPVNIDDEVIAHRHGHRHCAEKASDVSFHVQIKTSR